MSNSSLNEYISFINFIKDMSSEQAYDSISNFDFVWKSEVANTYARKLVIKENWDSFGFFSNFEMAKKYQKEICDIEDFRLERIEFNYIIKLAKIASTQTHSRKYLDPYTDKRNCWLIINSFLEKNKKKI